MNARAILGDSARTAFEANFGVSPAAVAVAPGRMNVVGEHTDYNGGFVLPAAIDRFIAVAVTVGPDATIAIRSDRYPTAVELPSLPKQRIGSWADYVLGVAAQVAERSGALGFQAGIVSDIPIGSGLSSSGALEVATAAALLAARGVEMTPIEIARLCQQAENRFVGAQTGIMDQLAALLARTGHAMLLDCRSLEHRAIPLPDRRFSWLLADTRVHHELASSAYNERRRQCEAAARTLGRASLREVGEGDLERIADPILRRRARHVITENARVLRAADALERDAPRELGPILFSSHMSLRDDFEVSCAELDCLVDVARGLPGVIGARMMGGGFGGCALVLVESSHVADVEQTLAAGYMERFGERPAFYRVHSVDGVMAGRS